MAGYLYKTSILTDSSESYGFNNAQEAANKTDFDTNFKALCLVVGAVEINETSFIIEKTYTQFKALIDGTIITWADVKLAINGSFYYLFLLTDTEL